jgi:hypothetical protein
MAEIKQGGYELHQEVREGKMAIFKAVLNGQDGIDYKPFVAASQLVVGTNYQFICTGKPVVANPVAGLYMVKVFVKLPSNEGSNLKIDKQ